jgi:hypothetical protein
MYFIKKKRKEKKTFLLCNEASARTEMKPQTQMPDQGYHTPQRAVTEEYGAMVE